VNDEQHAVLTTYAHAIADHLLLADWDILVERAHAADTCYAQVNVWPMQNKAAIRVCQDFFSYSPQVQREKLTHELMHALTDRVTRVLNHVDPGTKGEPTFQMAIAMQADEIEIVVHNFSRIIAEYLPLPELPPGVYD